MTTLFLICAVLGGTFLLLQLVLTALGMTHEGHALHVGHAEHALPAGHGAGTGSAGHAGNGAPPHGSPARDALALLGVRALAAGVAFFGIAGLALGAAGVWMPLAFAAAALVGFGAMYTIAALTRAALRLESDGTVHIERAIGEPATVYVRIPRARTGRGKVLLTVQGRTVEYQAETAHEELATGTPVTVVDVVEPDVVEVVETPHLGDFDAAP